MFSIIKMCRKRNPGTLDNYLEESLSKDTRIRPTDGELSVDQNIRDADIKLILRGFVFKFGMTMVHLNRYLRSWKISYPKDIDLHSCF